MFGIKYFIDSHRSSLLICSPLEGIPWRWIRHPQLHMVCRQCNRSVRCGVRARSTRTHCTAIGVDKYSLGFQSSTFGWQVLHLCASRQQCCSWRCHGNHSQPFNSPNCWHVSPGYPSCGGFIVWCKNALAGLLCQCQVGTYISCDV